LTRYELRQNLIITILGRKGSGKTTLAREIIADFPRVITLDSMGEYGEGSTVVWEFENSVRAILAVSNKKRFRLALRVFDNKHMLGLLKMAWEIPDSLVVVEETSLICSPSDLPAELARLIRFGRHRKISQLYIARRPSELPRDLTANSDLIITFQQREPRDLDYLRQSGFDERQVYALPLYQIAVVGDLERAPLAVLERQHQQSLRLTSSQDPAPLTPSVAESTPPDEDAQG